MIRWIVIAGLLVLGYYGARKTWDNFHHPAAAMVAKQEGKKAEVKEKGEYDISVCTFQGRVGNTIYTSAGKFTRGRMSSQGFVVGIDGQDVIRCRSPFGRSVFVIVEDQLQQERETEVSNGKDSDRAAGSSRNPARPRSNREVLEPAMSATPAAIVVAPYAGPARIEEGVVAPPSSVPLYPAYHNNVPVGPRPVGQPQP